MKYREVDLKFLITLAFLLSSFAVATPATCLSFYKTGPYHLSTVKAKIATPESLPTLSLAIEKIDEFIATARSQNGALSEIYAAALPQLISLKEFGQQLRKNGLSDQDQVFEFMYRFMRLVDLPVDYTDAIGNYADGFASLETFTQEGFHDRLESFLQKFKSPKPLLEDLIKQIETPASIHLRSSFKYISIGRDKLPDDLNFSFQYKHIFRQGLIPIPDLYRNRESGEVHVGISFIENAPSDGQNGNSKLFARHDILHVYTQKYYDQVLFDNYGAKTFKQKIRVKKTTNDLFQKRLRELDEIKNEDSKKAIELVYFGLLHELSLTYPLGSSTRLSEENGVVKFAKTIFSYAKTGYFGKEYSHLSEADFVAATEWVKSRVDVDQITLDRTLRRTKKGQSSLVFPGRHMRQISPDIFQFIIG